MFTAQTTHEVHFWAKTGCQSFRKSNVDQRHKAAFDENVKATTSWILQIIVGCVSATDSKSADAEPLQVIVGCASSADLVSAEGGRHDDGAEDPLLSICFDRILFIEDITYRYSVQCAVQGISPWTMLLTVEQLSAFYADTFRKWRGCHDAAIPDAFGKVMRPEILTECIQNVLNEPALLKSKDVFFSERTADLLAIPHGIRPIIQYDAELLDCTPSPDIAAALDDGIEAKFVYLAHRKVLHSPSKGLPTPSASYWVRLMPQRVDLLVTVSCGTAYVVMSHFAKTVAAALMDSVAAIDVDCAWLIADFLPKTMALGPPSDSRIVYKFEGDGESHSVGQPLGHSMARKLHFLCVAMQREQPSDREAVSGSAEEDTAEVTEFLEFDHESSSEEGLEALALYDSSGSGASVWSGSDGE